MFSSEAVPTGSSGYHRKCYQSYTNSKALAKFQTPATPNYDSKRNSARLSSPGESK